VIRIDDGLRRDLCRIDHGMRRRCHTLLSCARLARLHRVDGRQEQRERAAGARRRRDAKIPSEESGDLARDREAEAGAAVLAARRAVRLLERFEDQPLLVLRDPDAGI